MLFRSGDVAGSAEELPGGGNQTAQPEAPEDGQPQSAEEGGGSRDKPASPQPASAGGEGVGGAEARQASSPAPEEVTRSQTIAAGASSSAGFASGSGGSGLAGLTWGPGIFQQGRAAIDALQRHHALMADELEVARAEAEEQRLEAQRSREEARRAQDARAAAVGSSAREAELQRQLQEQRLEHQQALELLEASKAKAEDEHRAALENFQQRLEEKTGLITSYSQQIQQLRRDVGEQAQAARVAAEAAAQREAELAGQLKAAQEIGRAHV